MPGSSLPQISLHQRGATFGAPLALCDICASGNAHFPPKEERGAITGPSFLRLGELGVRACSISRRSHSSQGPAQGAIASLSHGVYSRTIVGGRPDSSAEHVCKYYYYYSSSCSSTWCPGKQLVLFSKGSDVESDNNS